MKLTVAVTWLCRGVLVLLLALVTMTLPKLSFDNNILALFPVSAEVDGQAQADTLRARQVERRLVLLITADERRRARDLALQAAETLASCDCITHASAGLDSGTESLDLNAIYAGHTQQLLSPRVREQLLSGEARELMESALVRLQTEPGSGLAARLAQDPLGTLQDYRQQVHTQARNITLDDRGLPVVGPESRQFYLVNVTLAASPYRLDIQDRVGELLDSIEARVLAVPGGEFLQAGSLLYTRAGTQTARAEVSTVGLGSLVGIVLLLLLAFRSPLLLLLAFVAIALGIAVGLSVTWWVFGSVHVMALVFGAALVGVAIDYSLHFFARRHWQAEHWRAREGIRQLLPPLGLGLMTSGAAYLSFTTAGFPGFSQIAVLSASGLATAFAVVVGIYPLLLSRPARRPLSMRWRAGVERFRCYHQQSIEAMRTWPLVLALLVLLFAAAFNWQSNDDIRQMQVPDPALAQMEQRVREQLGATVALPYILVSAPSSQILLQRLERMEAHLEAAVREGHLQHYQSLANWVPSVARQHLNHVLWQRELLASGVLEELYTHLGLTPTARGHFLAIEPTSPLRLSSLAPHLAELPQAPVYFVEENTHYSAISLLGLQRSQELATAVTGEAFARWIDPVKRTNRLLEDYRVTAVFLLLVAYGLACLLLACRYGRWAPLILLPPLLASALTLSLLTLAGQGISVFHMMALLLVLGIGVDYTLFLRESHGTDGDTTLAIGLSTLTTVLSFGLLSLSATAAIHYFGLTVLLGIVLAFLLAPLALTGAARHSQGNHKRSLWVRYRNGRM